MKAIGGFFELELPEGGGLYHDNSLGFTTGRACLSFLLEELDVEKVYLPYYCCDALFEPLTERSIDFEFYSIDHSFEIDVKMELQPKEVLIYINFFGLKDHYSLELVRRFGQQLILDNTHSFFTKEIEGSYSFTSARKYFGVPDGAYLYGVKESPTYRTIPRKSEVNLQHCVNRLIGNQELGFKQYQDYESSLNSEILRMSVVSEKLLRNVNYSEVKALRERNFNYLKDKLQESNILDVSECPVGAFCFPFMPKDEISRDLLYKRNLFIPTLWGDVLKRKNYESYSLECAFTRKILPLPIDHRYSVDDMKIIVDRLKR